LTCQQQQIKKASPSFASLVRPNKKLTVLTAFRVGMRLDDYVTITTTTATNFAQLINKTWKNFVLREELFISLKFDERKEIDTFGFVFVSPSPITPLKKGPSLVVFFFFSTL